ncbi:MAG: rhomboid family intramembrane serine protease [Winogradskyella sp.]|uniref:rhomboid family intramembrane serine protease n=1 Tax=Winogradskyella sp. TaxID=1883156 RepID=UPI0017941A1E|nr:rhomboid family intramembrane serine protease [Winogradskyella sp.]MBT8245513.1 rhomboid family intramembrane serine protease [Winogradskyella sp.]NNK23898.1 rhomboid family intramembrane serine protease [Winogradskyella sp.]
MSTFQHLKYKYNNLNSFGKIIVVNAIIFILVILFRVFKISGVFSFFVLPADFVDFLWQPWSIVTYGFLHFDFWHLVFNMLFLYYLSRTAVNLFRPKLILNVYFLGIIVGGVLFMTIANLWPTNFFGAGGVLNGASAGVAALLLFVATYMSDTEIRLFNLFNIKWKYLAAIFVGLDIFRMLLGLNSGGYVAHIGGYLLGFYYAKKLMEGSDIGKGFERMVDNLVGLFKPKSKLKTVHRKKSTSTSSRKTKSTSNTIDKQKQIDAILDKISKSGYESLTAKEKEFLFKAGK